MMTVSYLLNFDLADPQAESFIVEPSWQLKVKESN